MSAALSVSPLLQTFPRVSCSTTARSSSFVFSGTSDVAATKTNRLVAPAALMKSSANDHLLFSAIGRSPATAASTGNSLSWSTSRDKSSGPVFASASGSSPLRDAQDPRGISLSDFYQKAGSCAREKFIQEISIKSRDKDISLAKALLYIAAEDEAFMAYHRKMDSHPVLNEWKDDSTNLNEAHYLDVMLLAGKSLSEWLNELNAITREVEAELVSRDIGCHLVEVLEAVNLVLFKPRGFKRVHLAVDPKFSYLPGVLSSGCGSAIVLSIIYIEVCRRLGLTIVGSRVGEDFLIWPQTENPRELFKVRDSGHSLFAIINGRCVEDPKSMASDLNSTSLLALEVTSNRDIIGIALANLIRLHWKRASRMSHGLMLTSALRPIQYSGKMFEHIDGSGHPRLHPQELRLAMMASERLLVLQPHNWVLRRDYGMMLYYNKEYGMAVQELSICMAFAPEEEAAVLEPFVAKLHLMKLEVSWKSALTLQVN